MNRAKLMNSFKSKKFLIKIYLILTAVFFVILIIYTSILYYNTENKVLQNEYNTTVKMLSQIQYNIDFMDENVKNACKNLYRNSDVICLMFDTEGDFYDKMIKINRINSSVLGNTPYLHSVFIYNNNDKSFYSTLNGILFKDKYLVQMFSSKDIPKNQLIYRRMQTDNATEQYEYVFTYVMYEATDRLRIPDGALVVNIKPEWLFNNINMLNDLSMSKNIRDTGKDNIYIVNNNGEFLGNNSLDKEFRSSILEAYEAYKIEKNAKNGIITKKIKGNDYILTFLYDDKVNFLILKVQSFDMAFEFIKNIRNSIFTLLFSFLALILVTLLSISSKIYKPIGKLVKQVNLGRILYVGQDSKDEISYLEQVYKFSEEKLDRYENEMASYKRVWRSLCLKKLLTETFTDDILKDLSTCELDSGVSLTLEDGFVICIIQISEYQKFEKEIDLKSKQAFKYAIMDIFSDDLAGNLCVEGVDMGNDKLALLINVKNYSHDFNENLVELLKKAQKSIFDSFQVSVSIGVGNYISGICNLYEGYTITLADALYRYVYGKMSIITSKQASHHYSNMVQDYPHVFEKKIIDAIKSSNISELQYVLKDIRKEISEFSYNNIIICVIKLFNVIRGVIIEIMRLSIDQANPDLERVSMKILEFETIDDFFDELTKCISEFIDERESKNISERQSVLVAKIKEVIENNYSNENLCLNEIAFILKMSSRYIGRIFKESTSLSVIEYINEIRLKKASELLEKNNTGIGEILLKIGMNNETYFYRLFKRKFGVTPKEYSMSKKIKQ